MSQEEVTEWGRELEGKRGQCWHRAFCPAHGRWWSTVEMELGAGWGRGTYVLAKVCCFLRSRNIHVTGSQWQAEKRGWHSLGTGRGGPPERRMTCMERSSDGGSRGDDSAGWTAARRSVGCEKEGSQGELQRGSRVRGAWRPGSKNVQVRPMPGWDLG